MIDSLPGRIGTTLGRSVFIVLFVFSLLGGPGSESHGADWKPVGKDANDCQWFYDGTTVRYLPERKALVWLKRMVNDKQREIAVRERKKDGLPIEGYDRWAYELGLMELDCKEVTIRQLSVSDYDRNEKLLKSRAIGENVNGVTRDSIGEAVLNLICGSPVRDIEEITPRFPAF